MLRQGQALTNFEQNLPRPQSDLAREILKNPYALPEDIRSSLPTIEELEAELK